MSSMVLKLDRAFLGIMSLTKIITNRITFTLLLTHIAFFSLKMIDLRLAG